MAGGIVHLIAPNSSEAQILSQIQKVNPVIIVCSETLKNKITGIFDLKDNELGIKKSNLRNVFLDGEINGIVKFIPYFDFNLALDLNNVNFIKFYDFVTASESTC